MKNPKTNVLKIYSMVSLLLVIVSQSEAQTRTFGMRFMPTISNFDLRSSNGGTVSGDVTLGYGVGLVLGYNFSNYVGIQAEIIYSSISQKYREQDVERKVNLNYVNIPLMLSLNTDITRPINFNVVFGPQIGISAGGRVTTTGGDGSNTSEAIISVKKTDIGFAYGAGLDWGLNDARTTRFGIGFRGVYGLLNISENGSTNSPNSYYIIGHAPVKTYSAYIGFSFLI